MTTHRPFANPALPAWHTGPKLWRLDPEQPEVQHHQGDLGPEIRRIRVLPPILQHDLQVTGDSMATGKDKIYQFMKV